MNLPTPRPGLVIRYSFLWNTEKAQGAAEGSKDRPCVIWIRLDELNSFAWPGFDLRPIPGKAGRCDYGMLPPGLFQRLREGILARQKAHAGRVVPRD
jgi:hypothetical protein